MNRRNFIAVLLGATAAPAFAGGHGRLGTWEGINGHTVTGTAEIAGSSVNLLSDFVFDGAPDPKIALGKDGVYDPATIMGPLENFEGASQFTAPEGIDTSDYNEVWVWCEEFSVGLAIAPIG